MELKLELMWQFNKKLKIKKAVTEATTTRKVNYSSVTPKNQEEEISVSIYCLIAYVQEVGIENATFHGLKLWKESNWRE